MSAHDVTFFAFFSAFNRNFSCTMLSFFFTFSFSFLGDGLASLVPEAEAETEPGAPPAIPLDSLFEAMIASAAPTAEVLSSEPGFARAGLEADLDVLDEAVAAVPTLRASSTLPAPLSSPSPLSAMCSGKRGSVYIHG